MKVERLLLYIAVTAVSTYLIRMIPLVAIQKKIENRFFRSFLFYVPYAVLASMIMPAVRIRAPPICTTTCMSWTNS